MPPFIACPSCGCPVKHSESVCPHCDATLRSKKSAGIPRSAAALLLGLTAVGAQGLMGCGDDEDTTTTTTTTTASSTAAGIGGMVAAYGVPATGGQGGTAATSDTSSGVGGVSAAYGVPATGGNAGTGGAGGQ